VLISRGWAHLDVGLHVFMPELWDWKEGDGMTQVAKGLLVKPPVPIEEWGRCVVLCGRWAGALSWLVVQPGAVLRCSCAHTLMPPPPLHTHAHRYAVQLSLDGHAGPFRLPRQYLSGTTVVLQQQSPFKSWCAAALCA